MVSVATRGLFYYPMLLGSKRFENFLYGGFKLCDLFLELFGEFCIELCHGTARKARPLFVRKVILQVQYEFLLALGAPGPNLDGKTVMKRRVLSG